MSEQVEEGHASRQGRGRGEGNRVFGVCSFVVACGMSAGNMVSGLGGKVLAG